MAIQPLEQRLDSIIQPDPVSVEQEIAPVIEEPGNPAMEPVQVAGIGSALRGIVKSTAKAVKEAAPEAGKVAPDATKAVMPPPAALPVPKPMPTPKQLNEATKTATGTGKPATGEAFNYDLFDDKNVAKYVQGVAQKSGVDYTRITRDQVLTQVQALGFDDAYLRGMDGQALDLADLPVTVVRAAFAVPAQVKRLEQLSQRMMTEGGSPELMQQFLQEYALTAHVIQGAKNIQAAPAQALSVLNQGRPVLNVNAMRDLANNPEVAAGVRDVAKAVTQLTDEAAKVQLIDKVSKVGFAKDLWQTTFINGLLSSPVSHAKNIISNSLFGLYQIPERMVASFYSNVLPRGVRDWRSLVPGSADDKVALDEALVMVQSLRNGISEGLQLASQAWRTQKASDGFSKLEMDRTNDMLPISSANAGVDPNTWLGKGIDYYGTAITVPGRALLAEDEFFKGVLYRMELNAQAIRRGNSVYRNAIEAGLDEATATAKASDEVLSIMRSPPSDIESSAVTAAQRGTFTMDLPPGLAGLQKVFNHPALKPIVPFFRTPSNIALEVLERTPFAPLSSRWRDDLAKGGVYRDMALAKVTLGGAMLGTFASYAADGLITGSGPRRQADKEALMRDGWRPYSIKVGDTYYSYAGMEPIGALLAVAADYAEYAQFEPDDAAVNEVFTGAVGGLLEYMKEQPFLAGAADIVNLLVGRSGAGEPDTSKLIDNFAKQYGSYAIGGSPAGAYNSLVASIERIMDPTARDYRLAPDMPAGLKGFYEAFNKYRSRLPMFSEDLPLALNLWGDPQLQGRGNIYEMVLPTRVSPVQFSEVDDLLVRMGSPISMPERKLNGIDLNAGQYNRLLTIYGKELDAKGQLLQLVADPAFDLLPLDEQQKAVQSAHGKLMDAARAQLKTEDPDLDAKIFELEELRKANGLFYKP